MEVWAVQGIPEIVAGDDLGAIIAEAVVSTGSTSGLQTGDILVVTSKIVSKAEGRTVQATDREQAITDETVRVVATKGATRIVENQLGLVMAAAGVDSSNAPEGIVLLLPVDPDDSARRIKESLDKNFGIDVGVIISDTLGRAWRQGQTDAAIGAAGVMVLDDLRGSTDTNGKQLEATIAAVGDELASAAELVKGKANNLPVAVIRGLGHLVGESQSASELVRPPHEDLFRLGTAEAWDEGYRAGLAAGDHAQ